MSRDVRTWVAENFEDKRPFAMAVGPNDSALYWYTFAGRVVIFQEYAHGEGWSEYIAPAHNNLQRTLEGLRALYGQDD